MDDMRVMGAAGNANGLADPEQAVGADEIVDEWQAADEWQTDTSRLVRRLWGTRQTLRTAAVVVVAATVGGLIDAAWRAQGTSSPQAPAVQSRPPAAAAAVSTIVVDVHGDVRRPGLYRLPATARVDDAVQAAGGFLHAEDAEMVNRAEPLYDGSEVVIPAAGAGTAPSGPGAGNVDSAAVQPGAGNIDINTASADTLETLPGIGPTRANAIIHYRTSHGPFRSLQDLEQVPGIGPATARRLAPYVHVGH